MRYPVWLLRLAFAAWMIPAGLNHFYPLFPQPLGNQPESREMLQALLDTHLFTLVKAVELAAGLCLLTGFHVPLALVMVMPVSFCVFYWDTALQGWHSGSAIYGWAVLGTNLLLCLAYWQSYRALFAPLVRAARTAGAIGRLVVPLRLLLGLWMLTSGLGHFLGFLPPPPGATALAAQLTAALAHSELINVVMAIQLITGALLIAGLFVPLALCVLMPISVCVAWWAVILNQQPIWALIALAAVAANAALMLAHLGAYQGMLQRSALAQGENAETNYRTRYVDPRGRTAPLPFLLALIPLAAAFALYVHVVPPVLGAYIWPVLLIPAAVLLIRGARGLTGPAAAPAS